MRRALALLLCLAALLGLAGCGTESAAAPVLLLRYADNQPADYPTTRAAEYFAALVRERTGGQVDIRVFPDSELGNEIGVFEQMQFGGVDFARVSVSTLAEFVPELGILQLPYLFDDAEHMRRVLDGALGDELLSRVSGSGVVGLSWFEAGARNFYTRVPVTRLEDLEGLTIRVQESDFHSRMIRLLGAVPVQIPYSGVYSALQTGRIDGAENNWPSYEATGHYEAAPYYLLDGHTLGALQIVISDAGWAKLNEEQQGWVMEAAKYASSVCREKVAEIEAETFAQLEKDGATVIPVEDKAPWVEACQPTIQANTEKLSDLYQQILDLQ